METPTPSLWQRFTRFKIKSAIRLDKNRLIYILFAFTSLSDARNIISYVFEAMNDGQTLPSDRMHLWLMTPVGIAVATVETFFLMLLAILGSYFKETDKNPIKRALAISWPYVRESIKGVKNGYKGGRSLVYFGLTFGASALVMSAALLPLGVVLGVAYLASRIWYRHFCSGRKKMQSANDELARWLASNDIEKKEEELKNNSVLKQLLQGLVNKGVIQKLTDAPPPALLLTLIQKPHPLSKRIQSYCSAAFNGAVDGLYMYAGLYLLCALIPPLAIMVNVFAIFYVSISIIRGVYEEYCFQRRLELSMYEAEKRILEALPEKNKKTTKRLEVAEVEIKRLNQLTYLHALGEATRDGLGIYCGITGVLVFVSLFTPIPLPVVLIFVCAGVVGLAGAALYNLYKTKQYRSGNFDKEAEKKLRNNKFPDDVEHLRALAAGGKQAVKEVNYVFNAYQEQNGAGHYQSSPAMAIGSGILAVFLAAIYGLKALAKGFGRAKEELNLPSASSNDRLDSSPPHSRPGSPHRKGSQSKSPASSDENKASVDKVVTPVKPANAANTSTCLINKKLGSGHQTVDCGESQAVDYGALACERRQSTIAPSPSLVWCADGSLKP